MLAGGVSAATLLGGRHLPYCGHVSEQHRLTKRPYTRASEQPQQRCHIYWRLSEHHLEDPGQHPRSLPEPVRLEVQVVPYLHRHRDRVL